MIERPKCFEPLQLVIWILDVGYLMVVFPPGLDGSIVHHRFPIDNHQS